ncbi:MAG TPA: phosphoglycerate dehydrogenase [bacterium]|nr:phosphoglycerate dehydrogenase [bacterium]
MSFRVLVCARSFQRYDGEHHEVLRAADISEEQSGFDRALTGEELAERLPGFDAVIVGMDQVTDEALAAADRLRIVSMNGVGLDRIDVAAATRRGIAVTNTPGANAASVADHTLALMLAQARAIALHDRRVRNGSWSRATGHELTGRVLGLVGLGAIGREVARRAQAFGMRVQVFDPFVDQAACREAGIDAVDLPTLLATSDIVSLHCPVTAQTENMIDTDSLAAMKQGAVLINTARGELVDEAALAEALTGGKLAGAALDVFANEPPTGSPLLELTNVILTPHLGGNTHEAVLRTALQSAKNVVAVLRGGRPDRLVNPEALGKEFSA